jgi:ABC transporter substrate binding protein
MHAVRQYVEVGGLMSYGPNVADLLRRAAGYVDKSLKGAKPEALPVEQPTRFDVVINLKTAKALALRIPQSVLARADEVIQWRVHCELLSGLQCVRACISDLAVLLRQHTGHPYSADELAVDENRYAAIIGSRAA